jgi:hypothetical protein
MTRDGQHWREVPNLRIRVVYWLLSSAISEAYVEAPQPDESPTTTSSKHPVVVTAATSMIPEKVDDFPLGFSTGDLQVDRALTVLRMQFLSKLEQEQTEQNELLAKKMHEVEQGQPATKEKTKQTNRKTRK